MTETLLHRGTWRIVYRSYCSKYTCSGHGPAIDLEGPDEGHWHPRAGFLWRKPRTELDCVVQALLQIQAYELAQATQVNTVDALRSVTEQLASDLNVLEAP